MDMLGDPLFVGLFAGVVLGGLMAISNRFADSVRWRSGVWAFFCAVVTIILYFPTLLVEHGILTWTFTMGIPELRLQIAGWVGINWLTSAGFVLGMVALTLAFSGQQHDQLLAVKKACKYLAPMLFAFGFLLPVFQFFANLFG